MVYMTHWFSFELIAMTYLAYIAVFPANVGADTNTD